MRKIFLFLTILTLSFTACKKNEVPEEEFEITAKTTALFNNSQLTTIRIKGQKDLPNTLHETYELTSASSKLTLLAYEFKSQTEFEINVTTEVNIQQFVLSFKNSKGKILTVILNKTSDWVTQDIK